MEPNSLQQKMGGAISVRILDQVTQAPTIEKGLTILRHGIANEMRNALGSSVSSHGDGITQGSGPGGQHLAQLNDLYQGLKSNDRVWCNALLANTPQHAGMEEGQTEKGQTASKSAFA